MVNERDRFLSFPLFGTALDNFTGAPDDAFEVALLDANTSSLLEYTALVIPPAFQVMAAELDCPRNRWDNKLFIEETA